MIKLLIVVAILASPTVANPTMPGNSKIVISSTPGMDLKPGWHLPNQIESPRSLPSPPMLRPPHIPSNLPMGSMKPV